VRLIEERAKAAQATERKNKADEESAKINLDIERLQQILKNEPSGLEDNTKLKEKLNERRNIKRQLKTLTIDIKEYHKIIADLQARMSEIEKIENILSKVTSPAQITSMKRQIKKIEDTEGISQAAQKVQQDVRPVVPPPDKPTTRSRRDRASSDRPTKSVRDGDSARAIARDKDRSQSPRRDGDNDRRTERSKTNRKMPLEKRLKSLYHEYQNKTTEWDYELKRIESLEESCEDLKYYMERNPGTDPENLKNAQHDLQLARAKEHKMLQELLIIEKEFKVLE
jgi:hypothetical protein